MNKYELTVVVNAKIEDDVRVATVEKNTLHVTAEQLLMLTNGVKRD